VKKTTTKSDYMMTKKTKKGLLSSKV